MPYIYPDNYIVLCHGFLGTDSMMGINYFRGVKSDLESQGCKVVVPKVSMTGSIDERASQLNSQINDLLGLRPGASTSRPDVHLIGHSMGGLDARRLVHMPDLRYNVLSITTISTPHRGSPIASLSDSLGVVSRIQCQVLLGLLSGSGKAMNDMTPQNMAHFNASYKDVAGIKYYSVTSKFHPKFYHLFFVSNKHINNHSDPRYPEAFGENDGLVSVGSAKWGEYLGLEGDTSHVGVIGWGIMGIAAGDSNYNTKDMYRRLVDNAARKVEGKA